VFLAPVKKMTTSKKSFKSMVSLRDFDPENEDFGSEVAGLLSRNKKGASLQHGHLGDIKISSKVAIGEGFEDKKYAGRSVSRKELYSTSEESEIDSSVDSEDYSEEFECEDYSGDSEFGSEVTEIGSHHSEMESADYSDASDSFSGDDHNDAPSQNELSKRMRELEMADEQAFHLVSQARPVDDIQKSQHVRNQLLKFDDYVDLRFKLQPLLNSFNRLPERKTILKCKRRNPEIAGKLDEAVGELEVLMKDLLDLSRTELNCDGIEIPEDVNPKSSESKLQTIWDEMTRLDSALDPFARSSLQKWHNKMALSSDLKAKKTLKMLNQDPYQQVQMALQDEERLVARTRIYRDNSKKRLGCEEEREFVDIYDDNDFYQVLLKDWTASHGALSSSTASAMSAVLVSSNKKHRENVDQRASKGRKIRYDVHAKLINYMVPEIEKGAWNDSKIDEFYVSLLGQAIKSSYNNDNDN
jgi:protein AATF/BFR2